MNRQSPTSSAAHDIACAANTRDRIDSAIAQVKTYIQPHGGGVEVSGISEGDVMLKMVGACAHCPLANQTYNKIAREIIGKNVPEITKVVLER